MTSFFVHYFMKRKTFFVFISYSIFNFSFPNIYQPFYIIRWCMKCKIIKAPFMFCNDFSQFRKESFFIVNKYSHVFNMKTKTNKI